MKKLFLIPIVGFTLMSCVDDTPKCDSDDVINTLKEIVKPKIEDSDIYTLYEMKNGFNYDFSPESKKNLNQLQNYLDLYKGNKLETIPEDFLNFFTELETFIKIENIRVKGSNPETKKCNCEVDIYKHNDTLKNLQYSAQLNSNDEIYVEALIE